jgi:hypothetical protein
MIVLKPAEDDQAVPGCLDLVAEELEAVAKTKARDLAFDQPLRGLRQRPLCLPDADRERTALGLAGLDEELAEEVRFSRAASTVNALVARRFQQRLEYLRRRDFQNGQWMRSLTLGQTDAPAPHRGPVFVA